LIFSVMRTLHLTWKYIKLCKGNHIYEIQWIPFQYSVTQTFVYLCVQLQWWSVYVGIYCHTDSVKTVLHYLFYRIQFQC
jgi:hypothetical protein